MDMKLGNRRALVLGASQGLGKAIAAALVAEGAKVAVCSRDEGRVSAAVKEVGAACGVTVDLSKPFAGREAVEKAVVELGGGLDILVVNTGGPPKGGFEEVTDPMWQESFQGLWLSAVDAIRAALPGMRERAWGRILLITSNVSKEPMAGMTISNGLRAGLLGLANSLSREVAAHGITVNALLPGFIDTARIRALGIDQTRISAQIPAGRLGTPEELAAMAVFLASDPARYVTGQAISVDGGALHGL